MPEMLGKLDQYELKRVRRNLGTVIDMAQQLIEEIDKLV
jgi:hypothetical protein